MAIISVDTFDGITFPYNFTEFFHNHFRQNHTSVSEQSSRLPRESHTLILWNLKKKISAHRSKLWHRGNAVLRNRWRNRFTIYAYIFNISKLFNKVRMAQCRTIGRPQVRISMGFCLFSKRPMFGRWLLWKKKEIRSTIKHIDFVMCKNVVWSMLLIFSCLRYLSF